MSKLSRRKFLVASSLIGGAMTLGVMPGFGPRAVQAIDAPVEMTPRLGINPDDSITVFVTKPRNGPSSAATT